MKKNIFLLPVIFLTSVFCFCAISCSSGFIDEKGQVNITFSESSLRNLMARGAISEEAEKNPFNDSDLLSDFPNKPKIEYQFYGCEGQITDLEDFNEDDFDIDNAYILNFYKDSTYEVYSSSILNELADEQEALINGISEKDLLSNPDFLEMLNDPFAFYEQAIVSKGNWSKSGNLISISETYFYDLQTGSLSQSASPLAINISLDSLFFNIRSQSGVSLTFFNESLINLLDDEVENSDDKQNTEETTESQETSDKNLSIVVTLTAGDKNYEKTIAVKETDLHGSKSISFNNLTVGLNAKVTIVIYEVQSDGKQTEYAKGESNDFVVQSGINTTTIKIKKVDKKDEIVLPSGTIVNCYGGQLKDSTTKVANYILALYENNKYAVYEFSDEFLADENNQKKYSFEGVKDIPGIIAVVSRMLENGTVISFGTYTYSVNEYDSYEFKYIEQYYYDKDSKTYKASKYGGTSNGALSVEELNFSSQSGTRIVFFPFSFISTDDPMPSFNIEIKGFDKNDVTDLNGNICKVHVYVVKDALLRTALNTTLDADFLTDDKKAEILIPIIEACQLTKITTFNPNDSSNNKEIVSVDDSGNILWKGDADLGLEDNSSYGVLATIYFSTAENSGFYEYCVGYTDNLSYSSEKNKIEINVKNMDLPCNIYFYCDDKLDLQSTVRTSISDLRVLDKEGNIVDSVLTELYVASEEKIDALENDGYIADKDKEPVFSFMNGVPYVKFFYKAKPVEEKEENQNASAGFDINLEESTSNVRVLELNTYGGSGVRNEDDLGQQFTKVSIKDAPDLSGYTLIWKIDGVEEPERGTELNVYEKLLSSGIHKVSLLAVNADGTSFYEGETLISSARNVEERIVFVSTDRGLEFRVNRFTDDVSFEHVELKDEASGISVTTTFENSLSGWRGYWPFVEPNKEYTFILHGKIGDDAELVDRKLEPVTYKGNRNTPVTDTMKSYISSYKRSEKTFALSSGATGYACVTYKQSSQKELENLFREITNIEVTQSSLNFALFQVDNPTGWIWYMNNNYSSYGFIPEEMNEYDLIGNLPETDWGRNNALSHLENGVKILVTMYPAFVLNGDKNQYFKLPDLHSNEVEFSK